MPIKIFSHQADPDGLGCIILSNFCFPKQDYTLCKNALDLNIKLADFINNKEYLNYSKIFITDLCPNIDLLTKIACNQELVNKILIFDHHLSNFEKIKDKNYSFININLEECATSLFYDYLKKQDNQILSSKACQEFVLLTKLHDTWEWKKSNNLDAYHLETFLHKLGAVGYLNHFIAKLNLTPEHFTYNMVEQTLLAEELREEQKYLDNLIKRIIYKKINKIKYGIVYGLYNYRNSLSDKLKDTLSCDVLIFLAVDNETISFRSINQDVKAKNIAQEYQGGGHDYSASCSLNSENEQKIIKKYLV